MRNYIKEFLAGDPRTKIMEVETDVHVNRQIFDKLKQKIKTTYES